MQKKKIRFLTKKGQISEIGMLKPGVFVVESCVFSTTYQYQKVAKHLK